MSSSNSLSALRLISQHFENKNNKIVVVKIMRGPDSHEISAESKIFRAKKCGLFKVLMK